MFGNEKEEKRKREQVVKKKKEETLGLWEKYNNFVRSLHLPTPLQEPKVSFKKKVLDYLKKLLIIASGAFLTTIAFSFFINPNGLYNNGLNGILQVVTQFIIGKKDITWSWFPLIFQGISLLINSVIVLILWKGFKSKLEIISTALFYIIFKLIWSCLLEKANFLFSNFSPSAWIGTMGKRDLTLTLPYYVIIAIIAAVIHALGFGLIIKCQATPDGHDLILTHLNIKKTKLPINWISRTFNVFTVILIVIINLWFEENEKMRESFIRRDWEKTAPISLQEKENFNFKEIVKEWKNDMNEVSKLRIFEVRKEKLYETKNYLFNKLLKERTSSSREIIEDFAEKEYDFYIANSQNKYKLIEDYIDEIQKRLNRTPKKGDSNEKEKTKGRRKTIAQLYEETIPDSNILTYFDITQARKKELEQQKNENLVKSILKRITNNERIWATFVYIFVTSYLVGVFFPHNQVITINIHCNSIEETKRGINLIRRFCDTYYCNSCFQYKGTEMQKLFIITCKLSRWNYYLYSPYLRQIGKIYES